MDRDLVAVSIPPKSHASSIDGMDRGLRIVRPMRTPLLTLVVTILVLDCSSALALPLCVGRVELANARFVRVDEKTGALDLAGGRIVHLEGIRLPAGVADRAPVAFETSALSAISTLARSGAITLAVTPPALDRYRRLRAQAFVGEHWLQAVLLERGLARVSVAPDRTECVSELLAIEAKARQAGRGLWAAPGYAIRSPQDLRQDVGSFQIVEGRVLDATVKYGRAFLNFGTDWRTDFTVTVDPDDMANFRRGGVDPKAYSGQTIRVRGWVQWHFGPEIEVPNPQSVEVVR
jgi:micrococcal nuclease